MTRKTEYYVVVKKEGEKEGREVGALLKGKIVRVPPEFALEGLAMLLPRKIAEHLADKIRDLDGVESVKVERIPPHAPPPPKEATI